MIGLSGGEITSVGKDVFQVTIDTINKMQADEEGDTLTILAGQDMGDEEFARLCAEIQAQQPDLEIDSQRGEQPLYPIIFSIE